MSFAVYMPSYEMAQQQLSRHLGGKELFGVRHMLAGSLAGLGGSLVKVPVDVVKKRVQAGLYPNALVAILSILNEGGHHHATHVYSTVVRRALSVRFFYAGWRSSIFYDVPYNSVQFLVLENVKRVVHSLGNNTRLSLRDNVFIGAITGMVTSIITEPVRDCECFGNKHSFFVWIVSEFYFIIFFFALFPILTITFTLIITVK